MHLGRVVSTADPMMDVVYIVRPGDHNPELWYSLRSLANLPHDRVWIVGYKPAWVQGVEYVPGNRIGTSYANAIDNLRLACDHVEAERFVVMNDDFYVMEPVEAIPSWHAGPLTERLRTAGGAYGQHLRIARQRLTSQGHAEPIAWTLHIPLVVERQALAAVIERLDGPIPPEWRTMYGNLSGATGVWADDVKVRSRRDSIADGPFLSSSDGTFPWVRSLLAARFPLPGPYEVPALEEPAPRGSRLRTGIPVPPPSEPGLVRESTA